MEKEKFFDREVCKFNHASIRTLEWLLIINLAPRWAQSWNGNSNLRVFSSACHFVENGTPGLRAKLSGVAGSCLSQNFYRVLLLRLSYGKVVTSVHTYRVPLLMQQTSSQYCCFTQENTYHFG